MEEIKQRIVYRLHANSYWGRRLMNETDLMHGVPNKDRKIAKLAINELFEEGLLIKKPGNRKQFRYSLRPSRKTEI